MSDNIDTDRLKLRRFRSDDAARVTDLIGNLSVSRWLTRVPHPYTEKDARNFIGRNKDKRNTLAVTLSGEVIGACTIDAELGYWLGQPFWGLGYMNEAAQALVARYFKSSHDTLRSGFILGNSGSAGVLRKLGFVATHTDEAMCSALGRVVTLQKMTLSADTWQARA